jgi:hypothetical protein
MIKSMHTLFMPVKACSFHKKKYFCSQNQWTGHREKLLYNKKKFMDIPVYSIFHAGYNSGKRTKK